MTGGLFLSVTQLKSGISDLWEMPLGRLPVFISISAIVCFIITKQKPPSFQSFSLHLSYYFLICPPFVLTGFFLPIIEVRTIAVIPISDKIINESQSNRGLSSPVFEVLPGSLSVGVSDGLSGCAGTDLSFTNAATMSCLLVMIPLSFEQVVT